MVTGLALPADVRAEQQDAEAVSAVSESDEPAKLELDVYKRQEQRPRLLPTAAESIIHCHLLPSLAIISVPHMIQPAWDGEIQRENPGTIR